MYSFLDYTLKIVYKNSSKYYKCYICLDNLYIEKLIVYEGSNYFSIAIF